MLNLVSFIVRCAVLLVKDPILHKKKKKKKKKNNASIFTPQANRTSINSHVILLCAFCATYGLPHPVSFGINKAPWTGLRLFSLTKKKHGSSVHDLNIFTGDTSIDRDTPK